MEILYAIICFGTAAALNALFNALGLIPFKKAAALHWTERARLLYPVRVSAQLGNLVLGAAPYVLFQAGVLDPLGIRFPALLSISAFLGALLGNYPLDRAIIPQLVFRQWLRLAVVGWGLRAIIVGGIVLAMFSMPLRWSEKTIWVLGLFIVWYGWVVTVGVLQLLRALRAVTPAPASLTQVVSSASEKMGVSPRHVWIMDAPLAQAFALPFSHSLLFTTEIVRALSEAELEAVTLHELGHLSESRAVLAGRFVGAMSIVPWVLLVPTIHSLGGHAGFTAIVLIYAGLAYFGRRLARRMEERADAMASARQAVEGVYANALLRIYQLNQMPAVMSNKKQVHPHLYDRMLAAGITPDFPRPAAAERYGWGAAIWLITVGALTLLLISGYNRSF